jgi:hypothetical protein
VLKPCEAAADYKRSSFGHMAQQQAHVASKPGQLAVQSSNNSSSCVFKPISSPGKLESLGLMPVPKVRRNAQSHTRVMLFSAVHHAHCSGMSQGITCTHTQHLASLPPATCAIVQNAKCLGNQAQTPDQAGRFLCQPAGLAGHACMPRM